MLWRRSYLTLLVVGLNQLKDIFFNQKTMRTVPVEPLCNVWAPLLGWEAAHILHTLLHSWSITSPIQPCFSKIAEKCSCQRVAPEGFGSGSASSFYCWGLTIISSNLTANFWIWIQIGPNFRIRILIQCIWLYNTVVKNDKHGWNLRPGSFRSRFSSWSCSHHEEDREC